MPGCSITVVYALWERAAWVQFPAARPIYMIYLSGQEIFNSPTDGQLTLREVMRSLEKYIDEDPGGRYLIIMGSDARQNKSIDFVSAIVIHRKGSGGRYFWRRIHEEKTSDLRNQIYKEALLSIELGQYLLANLNKEKISSSDVEIHIDIGSIGPTRDLIKEVVGMVSGNGFVAKIKPESYAASVVADRHT